ncbi:MAG TPA: RICIN domain-containing protein, partial [Paludibacter sp.]
MKITPHYSKVILSLFFLFAINLSIIAQSGIYVGGHFRRDRTVTVPTLKASGFTYVILFNIQVEANGDLTTDGEKICSNGLYVFGTTQPNYVADVTSLKTGMTSVRRVESCIGGWGSTSYNNIKALVNAQETGSTSILYRNFQALKNAIPSIDAINNDDEAGYDVTTATAFHVMLFDLGFKTTLAPYMNKSFWQSLATNINNLRPGAVDRIDLQCYDGGASNNPKDWVINNITMHAGMLHFNPSTTITSTMSAWKSNSTVKGGFLWVYNANDFNLKTYAGAINSVFGGGEVVNMDKMKPYMTAFSEANYQGTAVNFEKGDYNIAAITAQGLLDKSISSIKLAPGFKAKLYKQNNYSGTPVTVTENTASLLDLACNDSISSLSVRPNGDITLGGKVYFLKNRKTGLFMGVEGQSILTGANIQQQAFTGNEDQKWGFAHVADGVYRISNKHSVISIQVRASSTDDNAVCEQKLYTGLDNQKMIAQKSTTSSYYKIIPYHSTKYLKSETDQIAANIVQGGLNSDLETDWEIILS